MNTRSTCFARRQGLFGVAVLAFAAGSATADINHPSFSSVSDLTLVGAATQNAGSIMLTPSAGSIAGAAWTAAKQNVSIGFDTSITFHVQDKHGGGADGVALVIQNSSGTALGGSGGAMGFACNPVYGQQGISNSLAIELDMWTNNASQWNEPGANHISFQSRGTQENMPDMSASLASAETPDLSDGSEHTLRVIYTSGLLTAYIDGSLHPALQSEIDLSTLLNLDGGKAWVGVTSGTGGFVDREAHVLDSWMFNTTAVPSPGVASLVAIGGLMLAGRRRRTAE